VVEVIGQLDTVLRALLVPGLGFTNTDRVRFDPPDDTWRAYVDGTLKALALNVYLTEARENRKLRSNEREETISNGRVIRRPAPARLDCHYLVSAWAPKAALTASVEPTVGEHRLLYRAVAILLAAAPINPTRVFGPGSPALAGIDAAIRDADLPTVVAGPEGVAKLPEFWGTMGPGQKPWRPVVELVVTLPVVYPEPPSGPIVTTRTASYVLDGARETLVEIGGTVTAATTGTPGEGAGVARTAPAGDHAGKVITGADGRFAFARLEPGAGYSLRVRAEGMQEATRPVGIPSPTGSYDVELT
jgi:hypothetical protein